jgi:hypothetical protein
MIKIITAYFGILSGLVISVSAQKMTPFSPADAPPAPDYAQEKYWSALPFREDAPDMVPRGEAWISDSLTAVDVFYIYPTIYQKGKTWNADVHDEKLNRIIDRFPVRFQASPFNHVGRVYVPRYRQAIIKAYHDKSGSGKAALDFAYEEVKRAFTYYLEHYNHGRPVIIASHSQGTTHSRRLVKDFFDMPESRKKLVCAYIIGFEIKPSDYEVLEVCREPEQVNCYVTWASFRHGYRYKGDLPYYGEVCVNPVSWKTDTTPAEGRGGVFLGLRRKKPYKTRAQIEESFLWVKSGVPIVQTWGNQHLVDFNLFWYDIRKNAEDRVNAYLKNAGQSERP